MKGLEVATTELRQEEAPRVQRAVRLEHQGRHEEEQERENKKEEKKRKAKGQAEGAIGETS